MIGLLVALVVLAGLMFSVGFASRERIRWRWLSQASLVVCAPLIAVVSYAAWQERIAVAQLTSFIDPYTPISAVTWAPPAPGEGSRHWIVTTPDPPTRVVAFYEHGAHLRGWGLLERGSGVLVLKKEAACLSIMMNRRSGARTGTSIVYALVPKCS
jgi:hypothetical protein